MSDSQVVELQAKLEKSEAARQKLRASLNLLKEKALNTGELVKQHQALQGRLSEAEQRAEREREGRQAAEMALESVRREQEAMRRELQAVKAQAQGAALAAEQAQAQAGAAARAQHSTQAALDSLRHTVAGLEQQVGTLRQQCQQLSQQQQEQPGGDGAQPPPPKRSRQAAAGAETAEAAALAAQQAVQQAQQEAMAAKLEELQRQYGSIQVVVQHWRQAAGAVGGFFTQLGSMPAEPASGAPEGAQGSIMLAPIQAAPAAATHASNRLGAGTVEQGEAPEGGLSRPRVALPQQQQRQQQQAAAGQPAMAAAVQGTGRGRQQQQQAAAAGVPATVEDGARQRAKTALRAAEEAGAAAAAAAGGGQAAQRRRLRSPTKRPRPAAAAPTQQQARKAQVQAARQGAAGEARPPAKRVRYQEQAVAGNASAAPAGQQAAVGGAKVAALGGAGAAGAGLERAFAPGGQEGEEGGGGFGSGGLEPSLAVSANGAVEGESVADLVTEQLSAILAGGAVASMQVVRSVAAELAHALLHKACPQQMVLVGFETAVLECAAPAARTSGLPQQQPTTETPGGAARNLHPSSWFESPGCNGGAEERGVSGGGLAAAAVPEAAAAAPEAAAVSPLAQSYAAAWCDADALRGHKLRWLLHCALALDAELASQLAAAEAQQGQRQQQQQAAAGAGPQPAGHDLLFCEALRCHLHRLLVRGCLSSVGQAAGRTTASPTAAAAGAVAARAAGGEPPEGGGAAEGEGQGQGEPPGEAPARVMETELCAMAAAAAGLCRLAGQVQAFRALLHDLLSIQPRCPEVLLPPLTAALEMWPQALPPLPTTPAQQQQEQQQQQQQKERERRQQQQPAGEARVSAGPEAEGDPSKGAAGICHTPASIHAALQALYSLAAAPSQGGPDAAGTALPAAPEAADMAGAAAATLGRTGTMAAAAGADGGGGEVHRDDLHMMRQPWLAVACLRQLGERWLGWCSSEPGKALPVPQPAAQPVAQPVAQPATQPVGQPVAQPAAQPVGQPVGQEPLLPAAARQLEGPLADPSVEVEEL